MTTVSSPRGLLMIGLSFWTGLLAAYVLCATGRVNVTLQPFSKLALMSPINGEPCGNARTGGRGALR